MQKVKTIFFGSTTDSVIILDKLSRSAEINLSAIVTQPPRPVGRKQILTPTPVELWAKTKNIPILSFPNNPEKTYLFADDEAVTNTLSSFKSELIISASFGQKIPITLINKAKYRGLNIHPSILPRWRGADPVPWAIIAGDQIIGVTIITLEEKFDQGLIVAQQKIPLMPNDWADPLRTKLFEMGAELFQKNIADFISGKLKGTKQQIDFETYARKLKRDDGFIPWQILINAAALIDTPRSERTGITTFSEEPCVQIIGRAQRALSPWPGLWSVVHLDGIEKRLKINHLHTDGSKLILDEVQLEGKNPVSYKQFISSYPNPD